MEKIHVLDSLLHMGKVKIKNIATTLVDEDIFLYVERVIFVL